MPNFSIMKLNITSKTLIYDLLTPVNLYLNLRDEFNHSFMLESNDLHSKALSKSYLGIQSIASFVVEKEKIQTIYNGNTLTTTITNNQDVLPALKTFMDRFKVQENQKHLVKFFGHTAYDAVKYFEDITPEHSKNCPIPELSYHLFQFVIQFDHHKNTITIYEFLAENQTSDLPRLLNLISNKVSHTHTFKKAGEKQSNLNAKQFMQMVTQGKNHCKTGDVFQVVLSRQFSQTFKGDEFNVYRALRSINPSPYLFYFDYGYFKIFGSSPEAQLKVENNKAILNPIAGTFKRSGNIEIDKKRSELLKQDSKENAEHNMLVDLARNDLSKHGKNVNITKFKSIQQFSHVIHLVSEVEADVQAKDSLNIFADTFPAGTLSGAPKYKALQLIDQYENQPRGFYGGSIGYFGLDGSVNQAITIRSFLSQKNTLYYQAGAGVVFHSNESNECKEVDHKLKALNEAINLAQTI